MDVRLSTIINSAENLVRDKEFPSKKSSSLDPNTNLSSKEMDDRAEFSNLLTGKFHSIQKKLSELQSNLSREQMRISYLDDEKSKNPEDLIFVLFGKEPLFPEIQTSKNLDLVQMKKDSESKLAELEKEIRYKEVENENVVALGSLDENTDFNSVLKGIEDVTWKPMNEKVVQKLIEL